MPGINQSKIIPSQFDFMWENVDWGSCYEHGDPLAPGVATGDSFFKKCITSVKLAPMVLILILLNRYPAVVGLKEESIQKLSAMIASGYAFPARLHNINGSWWSRCCDFSRALMQIMPFRLRVQKMSSTNQGRMDWMLRHFLSVMISEEIICHIWNSVAPLLGKISGSGWQGQRLIKIGVSNIQINY